MAPVLDILSPLSNFLHLSAVACVLPVMIMRKKRLHLEDKEGCEAEIVHCSLYLALGLVSSDSLSESSP